MSVLVDLVNFNADASCLSSARWLDALAGGAGSEMARWLDAFVRAGRKVSLGFTGATIADLAAHNPEALAVVDAHPEIFELVLRPFSHDIALLRSRAGFSRNVALGRGAIADRFRNVAPYFLPPEFMLTNDQVRLLQDMDVAGVFINASRFKPAIAARIPDHPYRIRGVLESSLDAIPVDGSLTGAYLASLHRASAAAWNAALADRAGARVCWRDGESWLFLPDGLERELAWLHGEAGVRRIFVRELVAEAGVQAASVWSSYPVHSFSEWVREFRMLGYLQRLKDIEDGVQSFSHEQLVLWLQMINSDVLSAVEKDDPSITIDAGGREHALVIPRSERGLEGEDFLVMFEALDRAEIRAYLETADRPHLRKLRARLAWISRSAC